MVCLKDNITAFISTVCESWLSNDGNTPCEYGVQNWIIDIIIMKSPFFYKHMAVEFWKYFDCPSIQMSPDWLAIL